MREERDDLETTEDLFSLLQGTLPKGYEIPDDHIPKLSADQAWTVIWYLQGLYWQPGDAIDRCEVCGDLYDSGCEGDSLDYGEPPYHFCVPCMASEAYTEKEQRGKPE